MTKPRITIKGRSTVEPKPESLPSWVPAEPEPALPIEKEETPVPEPEPEPPTTIELIQAELAKQQALFDQLQALFN